MTNVPFYQHTNVPFYSKGTIMAIEVWLPALLGYLIPVGLFLLAWGGMEPQRARRSTTIGALALALATIGYAAVGFAFHLGGARVVSDQPGLEGLDWLFASEGRLHWGLIGLKGFFLANEAATPEALALFITYLPLTTAAVLLLVLSTSKRARGWQVTFGGLLMAAVLFPVTACWVWGGGWLANLGLTLNLGHGFVDHAGSGAVYLLGGMAALGALLGLGQRLPRGEPEQPGEMPPAHFPLLANLGALLFGLGLMGWSLSQPFHVAGAELNLPRIAVNSLLAGAGAIFTSQVYSWLAVGHADALMSARGMAAGFVAIAASAPFVPPWAALAIGAVAGLLLPLGVYLVERVLWLPDGTATVALGVTAGILGLLAVALFADGLWGQGWNGVGTSEYRTVAGQGVTGWIPAPDAGFVDDFRGQMIAQLVGIGAIGLPAFLISWLVFLVLNLPYRPRKMRASKEEEAIEEGTETEKGSGWLASFGQSLFSSRKREAEREEDKPEAKERTRREKESGWLTFLKQNLPQPRKRPAEPEEIEQTPETEAEE
jgi:Amt family ammonium transporter